ncbi:MAG TPA: flavin reductase family protein [Desulfobacteraceae bacterium]|nr:flavin reductase family protein [Desulfobacteraceae bacterium]HPJ66478.1 flavin reductase family protein [Desulfobacteraceae bacterium]HPQ29627.1 flavin reductase family protein [Desulfobacteraceae bacterium]
MEIDLKDFKPRDAHDFITSSIIPRPIAWVSTINTDGQTNLAPFSFFTGVSWSPPVLAFSLVNRSDGSMKDTAINIRKVPEFVINIVSVDLLSVMEFSARPLPYGSDKDSIKGIHWIPSKKIKPFRVQEARISFECTLEQIVTVSEGPDAGNLILGRVQLVHVQDNLLKNQKEIDWFGLDVLGRLSANRYCSIRSVIESETN